MTTTKRRLLLLSVSAGAGHVRAAQALEAAALARGDLEVQHLDLLKLVPSWFAKAYGQWYLELVERHPNLWAHLYQRTDRTPADAWEQKLRRAVERVSTRELSSALRDARPDAVICTHFLPAELLSRASLRGKPLPPLWVQVTDFDLHRLWVQPGVTGYCVASDEIAFRLRHALPDMAVAVCGIPIMPAFAQPPPRAVCRAELGLHAERTMAMVMTGGTGLASGEAMVARLLDVCGDELQVVAIAGRNAPLQQRYEALARRHPGRLVVLGFTKTIERVMAAADLCITKPGGLSTSECLAMGLPMLLISPIPGQEERNAQMLLEQGAAWLAMDELALAWRVQQLLAQPHILSRLRERAAALGKPQAARDVVRTVFGEVAP
jgi:processive 1,2-diacylglycerol beta-glucosyltransferase